MNYKINLDNKKELNNHPAVIYRVTALWGFSEAVLGGMLHALKIPFTGLFVGSAAVIFISLLAHFSENSEKVFSLKSGTILKATFIVLMIKGFVSPYTPFTAYVSVLLQGLLGEILFSSKKHFKLSAVLLGILTLTFSALQKIIILTIIFGNSFWSTIDETAKFILDYFNIELLNNAASFSVWIISLYVLLHLIAGIYVGIFAANLPLKIKKASANKSKILNNRIEISNSKFFEKLKATQQKKSKGWRNKKSAVFILIFFFSLILLSYLYPEFDKNIPLKILRMIVRSIFIIYVWYKFLAPILIKLFKKFLFTKTNNSYSHVEEMMDFFPKFKIIIANSWRQTSNKKGLNKLKFFLTDSISTILFE